MVNILLTRPKEQSKELVEVLEKEGASVFVEPLFVVEKKEIESGFCDDCVAAIITSANACDALIQSGLPKNSLIFAVGKKTARNLKAVGYENIQFSPEKTAESLRDLIIETDLDKTKKIPYFHGSVISLDFKKELSVSGIEVENICSYGTAEMEVFSEDLKSFLQENHFDQVLLFSRNSAKIFLNIVKKHNLLEYFSQSKILCLSRKILEDVQKSGFPNSATFKENPILKNFYE